MAWLAPDAKESTGGLQAEYEILPHEPSREFAVEAENPRAHGLTSAERVSAGLTQLGAQLRLEMMSYAVGSLKSVGRGWSGFDPERRFSLSLTWQYLITGSLPALHRHYLLEKMTREQCESYEASLGELRRERDVIERVGFFPPWRTLESVTAEAVLECEIPGKLIRNRRVSRPAGRHPDGRRKLLKRISDRLGGTPRKGG